MFISSDTNIWIDFYEISHIEHPFLLNNRYHLSTASFKDELKKSEDLPKTLLKLGLQLVSVSDDESEIAAIYQTKYRKISVYDAYALSIAKCRAWVLLTGDGPLRNAAKDEGVECHGVIWVYDELLRESKISNSVYRSAIFALKTAVLEGRCRLPIDELNKRL